MLFDLGFGIPSLEGSADFGRPIADGSELDPGLTRWEGPAVLGARMGEAVRPASDGAGDVDWIVLDGDVGRANREEVDGVVGRGIPSDLIEAWDSGRRGPVGVRGDITLSLSELFEFSPGTLRSRSSSWVLSLGEREPTSDQIFSPI